MATETKESALTAEAAADAILALQKVIAAISASDPDSFFRSADTLQQVGDKLNELSTGIGDRAKILFMGGADGGRWEGEGAAACARIVGQFNAFLMEVLAAVRQWPEPVRGCGEALQRTWYEVDAVLAKHSGTAATPEASDPGGETTS
ncbi:MULTISPECIES: hypothetical protein [Streptomyces]|uniref:Uncharacterized protein n=1 Tax=Streptomyces viridochromogenes TaxID=1938 RepID=A0A0L8JDJ7_STRVR|nr:MULTISPECIES: hypothetical protein [Streptomyces]KOG11619.1 hypothetical protein ADK34_33970 [Streptomyces viridochromogenes]